jgi:hypothetical protein
LERVVLEKDFRRRQWGAYGRRGSRGSLRDNVGEQRIAAEAVRWRLPVKKTAVKAADYYTLEQMTYAGILQSYDLVGRGVASDRPITHSSQ